MSALGSLWVALRPRQWLKNLLVVAPLLFAQKATDPAAVLEAGEAFLAFCLLASSMYLFNDVADIERDRLDPVKRRRPIAAGELSGRAAIGSAIVLLLGGVFGAYAAGGFPLLAVAGAYVGLTLLYSVYLKHVVIVDVFCIAAGFVLRAVAGAVAIRAEISPWLIICTMLLALFLALAKRRGEISTLGEEAQAHRATLSEYSPTLLDQMIAVMTASTVMSYALYTVAERTVKLVGSTNLIYTLPFVIYGIFRYLYLLHQRNMGGHPEQALLSDKPLLINVLLYALTAGLIIYCR